MLHLKPGRWSDWTIRHLWKEVIFYLRTSNVSFLVGFSTIVGLGGGFGAILFRWMIQRIGDLFFVNGADALGFMGSYYVVLIPFIGGLIIGPLIHFFAREAKGHGVPEVMIAVTTKGGRIRPRVAIVKALASSICIGSGGSAGREGPIIQIGSAIGSGLGQLFRLTDEKTKILVACGAAAGIAATFNAPLGGIFFALEVILRKYGLKNISSVVLSSVTATVVSRHFLGDHPAFQLPPFQLNSIWDMAGYMVFGFITALVAWLYIKTLYLSEDAFNSLKIPPYLKPAAGGLVVGLIGLYFPQIFGVGYEVIEESIHGSFALPVIVALIFLKIIATSVTLGSGGSGGIFAPSLFIGALLGESFGTILRLVFPAVDIPPGAFGLVGMAAMFSGTAMAPISAIMLLFEMTGNYKILPPLMITCVIAAILVKWLAKYSIYTLKLVRRGILIEDYDVENFMETITVSETMTRDTVTVLQNDSIRDVGLLIKSTNHRGFPVLDEEGHLTGIVTRKDINQALSRDEARHKVQECMSKDLIVCFPDESMKTALRKLAEKNVGRIPVVERDNTQKVIGLITRKNIITTYNQFLKKRS